MAKTTSYRTYWIAWSLLLALTMTMILVEGMNWPRVVTLLVLVVAMLVKATVIGGWFMHLRFERTALVLSVVVGTLLTAALLFFLIVPDGIAMLRMAPR